MGHFFWPVTCAHMGIQLNPQPSHLGKVVIKLPPPPRYNGLYDYLWVLMENPTCSPVENL